MHNKKKKGGGERVEKRERKKAALPEESNASHWEIKNKTLAPALEFPLTPICFLSLVKLNHCCWFRPVKPVFCTGFFPASPHGVWVGGEGMRKEQSRRGKNDGYQSIRAGQNTRNSVSLKKNVQCRLFSFLREKPRPFEIFHTEKIPHRWLGHLYDMSAQTIGPYSQILSFNLSSWNRSVCKLNIYWARQQEGLRIAPWLGHSPGKWVACSLT